MGWLGRKFDSFVNLFNEWICSNDDLRRRFGKCLDRWFHEWVYTSKDIDIGHERTCKHCGVVERCVGMLQPDIDLSTHYQWETVQKK